MRMTYSPEGDTLDIELARAKSAATREIGPDVHGDYDAAGRLIAIEVQVASRFYDRRALEQLAQPVEYLTLREAAGEAQLSPTTLRVQIGNGRLPAKKQGTDWLVARHDLWNYLENRAPQGRPGAAPRSPARPRRPVRA